MNIALIYHKDPYSPNPRGGELSVKAIIDYLRGKGHNIALCPSPSRDMISRSDVALTWGIPAEETARVCRQLDRPLCLMVRFWKNVAPLPAGNLMEREIDYGFAQSKQHLFETADAIITNTDYARQVIERWQPISKGKVHVSYVPILGEFEMLQSENDFPKYITVVTPEIYGEDWLVNGLAELMPEETFLVVNSDRRWFTARHPNITETGYMDMKEVWRKTKVFLQPVYHNDICGTRRTTIEALRHGIPVIASDACGMSEKLPRSLLLRDAGIPDWVDQIKEVNEYYESYQTGTETVWNQYNTPAQLTQFEQILTECAS